jgi:RNA polymerase sigma-70 factor (ECF subfamily)
MEKDFDFTEAITPYLSGLRHFCMKLTSGSMWEADDLVQETLIKLNRLLSKDRHRQINFSFIRRVATNAWIDQYRKNKLLEVPLTEDGQIIFYDHSFSVRESMEVLTENLTPHQLIIFILIDVFAFSAKEVSFFLRSTEGAVKEALKRARSRLQHQGTTRNHKHTDQQNSSLWLESLMSAFREGNPYAICNAYFASMASGVKLKDISRENNIFFFTVRDPDGHFISFSSEFMM